MKKLYLFLLIFTVGLNGLNAATISLSRVYQGTGATYTDKTSKVPITTPLSASSIQFTSRIAGATDFSSSIISGNNVGGILTFYTNGQKVTINGAISSMKTSGNTVLAFYFYQTTSLGVITSTGNGYLLVVPGQEAAISNNTTQSLNSSFKIGDLNTYLTTVATSNPPVITSNGSDTIASISLNENISAVTTVTTTDADNDTRTYSIVGGLDASKFTINSSTGALSFINAPNYENPIDNGYNNTYEVTVLATDTKANTDFQKITITITNVNEAPVITSDGGGSTATINIVKNSTFVTNVTATDQDASTTLTYSISGGTNSSLFTINSQTGALNLINPGVVGTYTVIVTVSDGTNTDTQTITVNVTETDVTAPSLVITASDMNVSQGETVTIYFDFSEPVQGFVLNDDVTVLGGSLSNLTIDPNDNTRYSATFIQSGSTAPSFVVGTNKYTDYVPLSNTTSSSLSLTLDITSPTVTVDISGTQIPFNGSRVVTFTFSEDIGTSFTLSDVTVTNGTISSLIQTSNPLIWSAIVKNNNSQSGTTVTVTNQSYQDLAGNKGSSGSDEATLAPPSIDLADTYTSDTGSSSTDNYTSMRKPVIVGTIPDNGAGNDVSITASMTINSVTYKYNVTAALSGTYKTWSLDLSASSGLSPVTAIPGTGLPEGTVDLFLENIYKVTQNDNDTVYAYNSFIIDITNPVVAVTSKTTTTATPTITGTLSGSDCDSVFIVINGITYKTGDSNLTVNKTNGTWSLTIQPANALSLGTYNVTATIKDLAGNSFTEATSNELTVNLKGTTADGTWGQNSNWSETDAPNSYTPVQIQHNITIPSGNTNTKNIVIKKNGKITNQGNVSISGDLVMEVDENGQSAQFLNSGTSSISGKIIVRKTFTKNKWHYMSFPFDVSSNQVFIAGTNTIASWANSNSDNGVDFYVNQYSGANRASSGTIQNNSSNWTDVSPKTMKARHGYFIAMDGSNANSTITLDFVSVAGLNDPLNNVNTTSETYKNNSTINAVHSDWNLVGLPYVSSFDLKDAANFAPYYIYNQATNNFTTVMAGESHTVYPYSAFYLQASDQSKTTVSFNAAGRLLKAPSIVEQNIDEFKLILTGNNASDETRIRLSDDGTTDYQYGIDATKFTSPSIAVPQVYTITNGITYSVNTLPKETSVIPLTTRFGNAGKYTFSLNNYENISNKYLVKLTDNLTGKTFDLTKSGTVEFDVSSTGTTNRFNVSFDTNVFTGTDVSDQTNLTIYSSNKEIIIKGLTETYDLTICDITGRIIVQKTNIENNSSFKFDRTGTFILKLKNNSKEISSKLFIK